MHSEEAGKKDETLELLEEYLGQYRRAKRRQRRLEQRLKDIKEDMKHPIGGINYDPINKPQNSISQGAASFTFRLSDCELRIYEQKEQAEKDLLKIMDIFDYLDKNSDERNALEMYYIDGFKWERVAEELPCSRSQVFNLRETGLKKLLEFSRVREILRKYEAEKIA
jgi:DNA-directed RNA polymerase specialized sigma24 family protein